MDAFPVDRSFKTAKGLLTLFYLYSKAVSQLPSRDTVLAKLSFEILSACYTLGLDPEPEYHETAAPVK
jgi:hypothetical protein